MKEIHFYSSKITSLLMFGGSAIFVYIFFSLDKDRYSVFGVVMQYLGFILFLFSLIFSIALLLRRKPMLTVTDQ
ncbi:MAG: hypothetical protein L0G05_02420, partial [Chryseobacterium sp.]|nr:hypothetical protein [Chryseobacterium sp.]